jgi:hypothetical protein
MAGILMAGDLYAGTFVQGVAGALEEWPGVTKFSIKPNSELKEQTGKGRANYGQVIASVALNKPTDFNMTISDVTGRMLGAALQGTFSDYSDAAATVTDQDVILTKGFVAELGKANIKNPSVVVKNNAGTTTYVENTDYKVDYQMGFIIPLAGGAIVNAANHKVSFVSGAVTGGKILAGTLAQVRLRLVLAGINLNTGKNETAEVFEAALTADNEVDLMGDEFITCSFTGRMVVPTGQPAAMVIHHDLTYVAAA